MSSSKTRRVFTGTQSVGGQAEGLQVWMRAADEPVKGTQKVGPELQDLLLENIL